jgi:hypothetical protein
MLGEWRFGDNAHQAIYGYLKITRSSIQFSIDGKRWECKTAYRISDSGVGNSYPGQTIQLDGKFTRWEHSTNKNWEYFKLALGKSKCTQSSSFLIAFPPDETDFAHFVDYVEANSTGWGHFHRVREGE